MTNFRFVALVFFMLFCASGGVGVVVQELQPGVYPVGLGVRVGRVVEVFCSMFFYGLELLGLIKIRNSVQELGVDEKVFVNGVYRLLVGFTGHSVLYLMFN